MPRGWQRLSHSGRGLGEYVPFVGVMPGGDSGKPGKRLTWRPGSSCWPPVFRPTNPGREIDGSQDFPEVVTLPELIRLMAGVRPGGKTLVLNGRPIRSVAMIHCVGSSQSPVSMQKMQGAI